MIKQLDKVDTSISVRKFLEPISEFLKKDGITELCINKPNEIFYEERGIWKQENISFTYDQIFNLGQAVAKYRNNVFDELHPILSATLPDGERSQFVMPPVTNEECISVTIRRPSFDVKTFDFYEKQGFFNKIKPKGEDPKKKELKNLFVKINDNTLSMLEKVEARVNFLKRAVELDQNVVIAGETGSGKTTFMKALMQFIPKEQRIITIEDVPELQYGLLEHKNQVNLFYPSEAKDGDLVTATSLLKSCLRMKPDRILLAELRGGETYDFLNVCMSGHGGSITSCHAGSCKGAFDYLALKVMQNKTASTLTFEQISYLLHQVIDVVVHITNSHDIGRHITEIYYNNQEDI